MTENVKPIKERIDCGWLVEEVDHHTCGAGDEYGHEPGCGLLPLVDLSTLPGWEEMVAGIKAEAWGEGYWQGVDDARTADQMQVDIGLGSGNYAQPNRSNPYRA